MQTIAAHPADRGPARENRRYYRVERQFLSQRCAEELVRDLLRAHCGE